MWNHNKKASYMPTTMTIQGSWIAHLLLFTIVGSYYPLYTRISNHRGSNILPSFSPDGSIAVDSLAVIEALVSPSTQPGQTPMMTVAMNETFSKSTILIHMNLEVLNSSHDPRTQLALISPPWNGFSPTLENSPRDSPPPRRHEAIVDNVVARMNNDICWIATTTMRNTTTRTLLPKGTCTRSNTLVVTSIMNA